MDVVATRIITQPVGEGEEPLGPLPMIKKVYAEAGYGAFMTGWGARVGYWAPAIGIFLSCYCSIRQLAVTQGFFS